MILKTPDDKESELAQALAEFETAVQKLEDIYCNDDYKKKEKYEKSNLCRKVIEQANLKSLRYYYALDEIERNYEGIPKEQAERYISDVNRCLAAINKMDNEDEYRWGLAQQIATRRDLVARKFKQY